MIAAGEKIKDIADVLGCAPTTVSKWLKEPDVLAIYREKLNQFSFEHYARAIKILATQLESNSPWVAQGAAREIVNRLHDAVTGEASKEVVIRIEGMPDIGLPAPAAHYIDADDAEVT